MKLCWNNAAAYAKSRAFRNLGFVMWLVTRIFVLFNMILHRFEESKLRIVEDSSLWKVPRNQTKVLWWGFDGLSGQRSSLSTETFDRAEECKDNPAAKIAPQFFIFPGWWRMSTPDEFLLLWIPWVWNQRSVKRCPVLLWLSQLHHNFFSTKTEKRHWTMMIQKKSLRNQQVGESHGGPAITLF